MQPPRLPPSGGLIAHQKAALEAFQPMLSKEERGNGVRVSTLTLGGGLNTPLWVAGYRPCLLRHPDMLCSRSSGPEALLFLAQQLLPSGRRSDPHAGQLAALLTYSHDLHSPDQSFSWPRHRRWDLPP